MNIRNIAIIAHVDHGKTTLVDQLLKQSGSFRENQRVAERAMDSNDLEKERGITILAKATSVDWKDTRINIVDTPGHADFGGEVERILNMVDGVIVLVDAAEGPMPQTKFVVGKALKLGLRPIVAINKIDKPEQRANEVINEVFDLFAALDATDEQLDFPILYGSAKQGWMAASPEGPQDSLAPMFDLVLEHVPPPAIEEGPFRLLGTILEANPYLGRIITGRITSGTVKPNQAFKVLDAKGNLVEQGRHDIIRAELAIRIAQEQVDSLTVRAPFAGTVTKLTAHVGDTVPARADSVRESQSLLTLTDLNSINIDADVAESNISLLRPGLHGEAVLDGFPDQPFAVEMRRIAPVVSAEKGTIGIRFSLLSPPTGIRPNMAARIRLFVPDPQAQSQPYVGEAQP